MERRNMLSKYAALVIMVLVLVAGLAACASSKDEVESPVDAVKNPTKVVRYEESNSFKNDLEAMMDYAHALQAMRWAAMCVMSNDFMYDDLSQCAPIEDVERNTTSMPRLFQIEQYIVEHADAYQEAFERLEEGGVFDDPAKTRNILSDGLAFIFGCRQSQVLGRKSVLAVMQKTGSTTNPAELERLFDIIPAEQRRGYNDAVTFWKDFSAGRLDSRANVIFQNLYTYDYINFGSTAKDMGISPAGNMSKTTADLVEKGGSLIIDVAPGNLGSSLGYAKDIWQTYQVTEEVGKHAIKGELSAEDGKKVLQQIFNLSCNYADQLKNFKETGKFEGTMNLIDDWDFFAAVDILNTAGNTMVFSDEFKQLFPPELKQQITSETVTITDKNGNQIPLIILRDNATGDIRVSFTLDKDGKIIMLPKDFGTKTLTVVDRQGRRHTKTVIVDKDKPTKVEIDLEELEEEDVTVLEDEPENGYIYLQPGSIYDKYGLSGTEEVRVRTNYLYYKAFADQESKWLSAKERSDMSQVVITYAANDTGEQRQGKVYVVCTNKDGKVLKQEVIKVTQDPKEATGDLIWATPSSISFDAEGGKQNIVLGSHPGYSFIGCVEGNDLAGWCYLEAVDSDPGSPTYAVNCEPNTTGEERSGVVTFYTANSKSALEDVLYNGVKADGTNVASTTVLIKQLAGSGGGNLEVSGVDLKFGQIKVQSSIYDSPTWLSDTYGYYSYDKIWISDTYLTEITKTENSWHIEYRVDNDHSSYPRIMTVSFDLDDINKGIEQSIINNLTFIETMTNSGLETVEFKITVSNAKFNHKDEDNERKHIFTADSSSGSIGIVSDHVSYVNDPDNKVEIVLYIRKE